MPKSHLPPNDELLRLLRATYSRYSIALRSATAKQKFTWQMLSNRRVFVEEVAGHLDEPTRELLATALNRECALGLTPEAALKWAKQSLAAKRRWRRDGANVPLTPKIPAR
ncbi:hypothetical protein ACH79_14270 [Bradyrhizobium sp. CCBAU 051011]|uniref:hypothetical protein n=1 Tax=Bradyrhizobium sp. CCBAU 051011 TaxID=858422 RepID=UPI0013740AB9|nr:hypothetical protein [Bradyrhizobium sp. CCBAU 051011]QHO73638.1 hypothetical protein ACH79_14270 [Bradyrhizobium sp. CCBAU 051011]